MGAIFISYRRGDSEGQARALAIELGELVGRDQVFMDVDSIALGRDFRQVLQEKLGNCEIMLALIGPNWLDAKDAAGNRRLDSSTDFVREEIASALKRNIAVTPVLLQGAAMPPIDRLPLDLQDLAFRNGFELSHTRWESDYRELVKRLGLAARTRTLLTYTGGASPGGPPSPPSASGPPATAASSGFQPGPASPRATPAPAANKSDDDAVPPAVATPSPRRSRRPVMAMIAAAATLLVMGVAAWVWISFHPSGTTEPAQSASPTAPAGNGVAAAPQFAGSHHLTSALVESANKCLESGDGTGPVQMNPCGNYSGQMWTIAPASGAYDRIQSVYTASSNQCLESGDGSVPARMNLCGDSQGQLWKVVAATQFGYYRLQTMGTEPQNMCLESGNGSSPSKMNTCANVPAQLWRILEN